MDRGTSNKRRDIFYTYIEQPFTGFKCRPSDMRRKETVSGCKQWIVCPRRFHIEHIGAERSQPAFVERLGNSKLINKRPPTGIDKYGRRFHHFQAVCIDHVVRFFCKRTMKANDVALGKQLIERCLVYIRRQLIDRLRRIGIDR